MGVFYFKPRDRWASQWTEDGKKKRRYFKTEQEAIAFESERLTDVAEEDDRLTLGELAALYYRSNPNKHEKTKKNVMYFLTGHQKDGEHIEGVGEFLCDKYADALTRRDLEQMREAFRVKGTSNNTINKRQAYIRAILVWGVDQELIPRNPWRDFKLLPVQKTEVVVTLSQIQAIFTHAPDWLKWAIMTAYCLSVRPGQVELFGLLWTAFDWRRGVVRIKQGKSGKYKTVYPPAPYMDMAKERYAEDMAAGIPLVCHRKGRRVLDYRTAWDKTVKDAGLPHMPMYSIRHAAASEMLARGADLSAVAAQLGHSTITTTGTFYAHVTPGSQQRAAALLPGLDQDRSE